MNITNKIYDIISNLVDTMMEKTILPERELQTGNKYYIEAFIPNVVDEFYRDPDRNKITNLLYSLNLEDIRYVRTLLTSDEVEEVFKYITTKFGYEELGTELYNTYRREQGNSQLSLKEENRLLRLEVERLTKELEKYTIKADRFTRDNITKSSIMAAKVKVLNGEYKKEYASFKDAIKEEMIYEDDITGGFTNIVSLCKGRLKKAPDSNFVAIRTNTGYRIDFYFEN